MLLFSRFMGDSPWRSRENLERCESQQSPLSSTSQEHTGVDGAEKRIVSAKIEFRSCGRCPHCSGLLYERTWDGVRQVKCTHVACDFFLANPQGA